jgi:hypothetical protein
MARCGAAAAAESDDDVDPVLAVADECELAAGLLEQAVANAQTAAPAITAPACQEPARRGSDKWIK